MPIECEKRSDESTPHELVERLQFLENETEYHGLDVANAIAFTRWGRKTGHMECFLSHPPNDLLQSIRDCGLLDSITSPNKILTPQDISWTHFLAAFAAYAASRIYPQGAYLERIKFWMKFDPALRPDNVEKSIVPAMTRSFWYTVGGDYLQLFVHGSKATDASEFRGDIAGLDALQLWLTKPTKLKISEVIRASCSTVHALGGSEYRNADWYRLARDNLTPLFGHHIVKSVRRFSPSLYNFVKDSKSE